MNYENAYKLLEEKGQLHLLKYYDTLSEAEQAALMNQISEIDFSLIDMIGHNSSGSDSDIAPVAALQMDSIAEKYDIYKNAGLEAIKAGDLALVLLAGGQGNLQRRCHQGYVYIPASHRAHPRYCEDGRYLDPFLHHDQ